MRGPGARDGSGAPCAAYLGRECVYEPGAEMHAALFAFRDAAAKLGLCRADLEPEAIELVGEACAPRGLEGRSEAT